MIKLAETTINPLTLSMSYQWYNRFAGLSFEESAITDPIKRTETMRECSRYLNRRFGDVGLGSADPEPEPVASVFHGDRFVAALFG